MIVPGQHTPGPWEHKMVSAGGARFHTAISGDGPHTVLLLHDFPQSWWSWRNQLPELADHGYRAVAMDIRGFGATDYPASPASLARLRTDAISVLRALGTSRATVVGAGMGGTIAWALAHQSPSLITSVVVLNTPHPVESTRVGNGYSRAYRHGLSRRRLADGELVHTLLNDFSAPHNRERMLEEIPAYARPFERRTAAIAAMETMRVTMKVPPSERDLFEPRVTLPLWSIRGADDRAYTPAAYSGDPNYAQRITQQHIPHAGHFLPEEAPAAVNQTILHHLAETNPK